MEPLSIKSRSETGEIREGTKEEKIGVMIRSILTGSEIKTRLLSRGGALYPV
jgi:hypothetical protein